MPARVSDDAIKAHTDQYHHKHLDFNSVKELPESHAWASPEEHVNLSSTHQFSCSGDESVPLIDLNHPQVLDHVGFACRTWGVFQITNHGISQSLLDAVEATGKSLFSLPLHQKLRAARPPDGISGYGVARISSFFPKLMWSEGFTIFGSPLDHARLLWPQDYTKFCDVIGEYERAMQRLAGKLMWLILGSLGVTREDVKWAGPKGDFKGLVLPSSSTHTRPVQTRIVQWVWRPTPTPPSSPFSTRTTPVDCRFSGRVSGG
ncbi:Gibberellin 3-beta-dioxygenase [Bertholletia excelsa]